MAMPLAQGRAQRDPREELLRNLLSGEQPRSMPQMPRMRQRQRPARLAAMFDPNLLAMLRERAVTR